MAIKEILTVGVETSEGAKSLKQLKAEFKNIQSELENTKVGTKQYTETLKKLADTRDEIDDLNDSVKALQGAGRFEAFSKLGGTLSSGFQAATGAAALFGTKSEEVEKTLVKLQAVMAFSEGLKGLEGIGDAFKNAQQAAKALWTVIAANPLVAIIAVVAALGLAALKLADYFSDEAKEVRALTAQLNEQKLANEDLHISYKTSINIEENRIKVMQAQGKSTKELKEAQQKLNEQKIKDLEISIETLKTATRLEQATLKQISASDSLYEMYLKLEAQALRKLGNDKLADLVEAGIIQNKKERVEEQRKKTQEAQQAEIDAINSLNNLKTEIAVTEIIDNKKAAEDYKKKLEEKKKADEELADWKRKHALEELAALELEDAAFAAADDEERKQRELKNQAEIDAEKEKNALIIQESLDRQARLDAIEAEQLKNRKLRAEAAVSITEKTLQLSSEIINSFAGKDEASQRKAFELNKKVQLAQATISMLKGIQGAFSSATESPITALFPAYPFIQAGLAGAFGLLNIKKIADTQFQGGGSASVSGGGGGANFGSFSQSPISGGVNNTSTLLNQNGTVQTPPPQKVYVTQTDIHAANSKIEKINIKAKIE